jgi:hypothetical protein
MRRLSRGPCLSVGEGEGKGVMGSWAAAIGQPVFVGPRSAAVSAGWVEQGRKKTAQLQGSALSLV